MPKSPDSKAGGSGVDEGGEPGPDPGGVPLEVSGNPPPLEDGVVCSSVGMEGMSPTMARAHAGMPASAAVVPRMATTKIRFMEQGMAMRSLLFARDATLRAVGKGVWNLGI